MNNRYLLFNCKDCGYATVFNSRANNGKCPECNSKLFKPLRKSTDDDIKKTHNSNFIPPPSKKYQTKINENDIHFNFVYIDGKRTNLIVLTKENHEKIHRL